jgi:hypothetical protein
VKYILYINADYPAAVRDFFKLFDGFDMAFLPDFVGKDSFKMESPVGFSINNIDSLFIRNS